MKQIHFDRVLLYLALTVGISLGLLDLVLIIPPLIRGYSYDALSLSIAMLAYALAWGMFGVTAAYLRNKPYWRWTLSAGIGWYISLYVGQYLLLLLIGPVNMVANWVRFVSVDFVAMLALCAMFGTSMSLFHWWGVQHLMQLPRWWILMDSALWALGCAAGHGGFLFSTIRQGGFEMTAVMLATIGIIRSLALWLLVRREQSVGLIFSVGAGWTVGWIAYSLAAGPIAYKVYELVVSITQVNNEGVFNSTMWFVGFPLVGLVCGFVFGLLAVLGARTHGVLGQAA